MTDEKTFDELVEEITNMNVEYVQREIEDGFMKMYKLAKKETLAHISEKIEKLIPKLKDDHEIEVESYCDGYYKLKEEVLAIIEEAGR